ncbi:hypothetical protein [uncultured Jatrophihabitans sp.]|uniref:hypothetical protein n=1 Tax=uncultured Jatrophihabitans sp. TaxID=1610747 RepID=UPI0035CC8D1E
MTFQPPPGDQPPGNQPPPGGQPPAGQWGPPPTGRPSGAAGFDPKTINPLDWGILGAGVLAFILSFIDFYDGADVSYRGRSTTVDTDGASAWHDVVGGGFFGWFAMVFAIAGAVLVALALFRPQVKLPVPARLAGLGLFALALLFEIIAIFVTPGADAYGGDVPGGYSVDTNHGFGFWASLIVIIAGLALSLMRFQATGGQLPGGLQSKVPNMGGYGPQGGLTGGSAPQQGARPGPGPGQQPPPPPGYGQPQPPTSGGQQPPPPPGYGPPQ